MKSAIFILLFFLLLKGCEEYEQVKELYPTEVWTFPVVEIDSTGATLKGDMSSCPKSPIHSFGFQLLRPDARYKISFFRPVAPYILYGEIDSSISPTSFEARIDTLLIDLFSYNVRAFVKTEDQIIFGNTISFRCEGSEQNNWSLKGYLPVSADDLSWPCAFSKDSSHYLISKSGYFYSVNPETLEMHSLERYPEKSSGHTGTNYISTSTSEAIYVLKSGSKDLYAYINGHWSVVAYTPFNFDYLKSYSAFSFEEKLYFLTPEGFYSYYPSSNRWNELTLPPGNYGGHRAFVQTGDKAYLFTDAKDLLEYEMLTDSWSKIAEAPGDLEYRDIAFSYQNKLYFELLYQENNSWNDYTGLALWSYDIHENTWEIIDPIAFSSTPYFFHLNSNSLYIGYWTYYGGVPVDIWQYDLIKE